MGFSSALQGRAAHEALLVRQDAELRLLDTMKRCLSQKVKCDKEYAIALAAVSQQGLKIDRADDLQGSLITKAWRAIMEEWDQTAKQLKSKAELLESVCQDKLTHLYQDKRKARKTYQEEHSKIAAQFTTLTEEVAKKKVEYQKHLEYYKVLRSRFEEHYIKSGRGGRKLDDVRDKYQKACRKLHLAHNEYVLLISEAIEVEKDFRTILLPGLLEHQQSIQENFITEWKNILHDASRHGDFTADKFQEIQRRIESNLQNVNPAEEYREFTEKHKTSPAAPVIFQFDQSLIEDKDSLGNKLQPNSLTVDNLTVDWLRLRQNEFETSIKECQEKQTKLMENGTITTPIMNGVNGGGGGGGKDMNKQSKDLNTLRCQERQMLKLAEMIKTALNEVGCEELPSGCDDLSVDQGFIENNVSLDQPDHQNSSFFLQKGAVVISMIKAPFKRKSAPIRSSQSATSSSPKTTPRSRRGCSVTRSVSLGSSVNSLNVDSNSGALAESDIDNDNLNCSANIYAEIDVNNSLLVCANNKPINNSILSDSSTDFGSEGKMGLSSEVDGEGRSNGSKNNLLEVDVEAIDDIAIDDDNNGMWTGSVDTHLDNIDKINKILDEKMLTNHKSESKSMAQPSQQINRFIVTKIDESVLGLESNHFIYKKTLHATDNQKIHETIDTDRSPFPDEVKGKDSVDQIKAKNILESVDAVKCVDKKNRFIVNKSVNAFLTSFKELKMSRKKSDDDVFEEIDPESVKEICLESTSFDDTSSSGSTSSRTNKHEIFEENTTLLPQTIEQSQPGCSKPTKRTLKSRLQHNIKSKLKFNIKLTSKKRSICQRCLKQRKIHPKNIFGIELTKDWNGDGVLEIDFCCCPVDDLILSGMTLATNRPLYEEEWFHGVLPREEVVRLLKNEGDFLVRETIRNDESQIVLSVCWNGHKHFIVQITADGHFRFEGPAFPSIQELIMHQHLSEAPVTGRSGAVLKKPVLRERWELSNDDVILQDKIGRGNFGDVYKARLKSSKKQVAVKTCRMTLPEEQKRKFLQEGRILKQYDHPNIVKLIGICVQKQPIMIVMELVPGGSLLNYLRKNATTLNTKQLMCMCRDAASGMRYLESKNCIHRDLAARNCLIGYENIVKISDFGMSREEEEYIVSDGMKQIPIKWTAPEALNFGKYTSLCDVWSYGILMWEIFTGGDTPYTGMSNSRARERIDSGYRMPAPDNTPQEMHRLMLKCWSYEAEARPHFEEIYNVVEALIARDS